MLSGLWPFEIAVADKGDKLRSFGGSNQYFLLHFELN